MAAAAPITSALALHSSLVGFASAVPDEDSSDAMIEASSVALASALAIPSASLTDVRMKLTAIMADAGCGLVEVDDLAFIARDIEMLIGRVQ